MRLDFAIQFRFASSTRTALERSVQPFFDKSLPHPLNRSETNIERFLDILVSPTSIRLIAPLNPLAKSYSSYLQSIC